MLAPPAVAERGAWRVARCTGKLFGLMAGALLGGEDLLCWYNEF